MKTAGMIGGIGPESTIVYYRRIIERWQERTNDGTSPCLMINSIDVNRVLSLAARDREALTSYVVDELRRLQSARIDFAFFASNTPHLVFDEVQRRIDVPLLSIVDATRDVAQKLGLRKLALFGTRFTMESRFYADRFAPGGMRIVAPDEHDRTFIHDRYVNELLKNVFRDETREGLLAIVRRMIDRHHIDSVILGGTELPLILKDSGDTGVPFLDTTTIHADAVVERMLQS